MTQNDVFKKYHKGTLPKNQLFFGLFFDRCPTLPYCFSSPAAVIRARRLQICTNNVEHVPDNKLYRHSKDPSQFTCNK
jgi:hypothetical protein